MVPPVINECDYITAARRNQDMGSKFDMGKETKSGNKNKNDNLDAQLNSPPFALIVVIPHLF